MTLHWSSKPFGSDDTVMSLDYYNDRLVWSFFSFIHPHMNYVAQPGTVSTHIKEITAVSYCWLVFSKTQLHKPHYKPISALTLGDQLTTKLPSWGQKSCVCRHHQIPAAYSTWANIDHQRLCFMTEWLGRHGKQHFTGQTCAFPPRCDISQSNGGVLYVQIHDAWARKKNRSPLPTHQIDKSSGSLVVPRRLWQCDERSVNPIAKAQNTGPDSKVAQGLAKRGIIATPAAVFRGKSSANNHVVQEHKSSH